MLGRPQPSRPQLGIRPDRMGQGALGRHPLRYAALLTATSTVSLRRALSGAAQHTCPPCMRAATAVYTAARHDYTFQATSMTPAPLNAARPWAWMHALMQVLLLLAAWEHHSRHALVHVLQGRDHGRSHADAVHDAVHDAPPRQVVTLDAAHVQHTLEQQLPSRQHVGTLGQPTSVGPAAATGVKARGAMESVVEGAGDGELLPACSRPLTQLLQRLPADEPAPPQYILPLADMPDAEVALYRRRLEEYLRSSQFRQHAQGMLAARRRTVLQPASAGSPPANGSAASHGSIRSASGSPAQPAGTHTAIGASPGQRLPQGILVVAGGRRLLANLIVLLKVSGMQSRRGLSRTRAKGACVCACTHAPLLGSAPAP